MSKINMAELLADREAGTGGAWEAHGGMSGHKGDVFSPTAKMVTDCHHIVAGICASPGPR